MFQPGDRVVFVVMGLTIHGEICEPDGEVLPGYIRVRDVENGAMWEIPIAFLKKAA